MNQLRGEFEQLIARNVLPHRFSEASNSFRVGSIKVLDAYHIENVIKRLRPKRILEVGCFVGFSSRWMLECSESWRAEVLGIDPSPNHPIFGDPQKYLTEFVERKYPSRFRLKKTHFGRDDLEVSQLGLFDLVFIDGDHSYAAVKADFQMAKKLLAPNGVILFHDALSWPDVERFLSELKSEIKPEEKLSVFGSSFFWFPKMLRALYQKFQMKPSSEAQMAGTDLAIPVANSQGLKMRNSIFYDLWFDGVGYYKGR